jgi:hypothetical protein
MDEKSENFHQKSKIFGKSKNRFFEVLDHFFSGEFCKFSTCYDVSLGAGLPEISTSQHL